MHAACMLHPCCMLHWKLNACCMHAACRTSHAALAGLLFHVLHVMVMLQATPMHLVAQRKHGGADVVQALVLVPVPSSIQTCI